MRQWAPSRTARPDPGTSQLLTELHFAGDPIWQARIPGWEYACRPKSTACSAGVGHRPQPLRGPL